MADINYSTEFKKKTADALTVESFLAGKTNQDYSWDGSKSIEVATVITQDLSDYNRNAADHRYGTPTEISDSVQTMTVEQDKSYSVTVDKGRMTEQKRIVYGAKVHGLQAKEKVVPFMDKFAVKKWGDNAGGVKVDGELTSSTALDAVFAADTYFANHLIPENDRYLGVPATIYNAIRNHDSFIRVEALGQKVLEKGVVGEIANMKVVKMPDSWFTDANINFIAWQKKSVLLPKKLEDAKIHTDAPGYSGDLIEGRYLFDAFVLNVYKDGVYVSLKEARSA